eukprot:3077136-Amphidinium_carterae.1
MADVYSVSDREERRQAKREKLRKEKQFNYAAIRMDALMGPKRHTRWEGGHLEHHARPLSQNAPESGGLERVYPHARPYPSITEDDYTLRTGSHFPGLLMDPKRIVYADEKGRYPFSCVPHLPDVDRSDPNSIEARRSMERRALYETIENKSWNTTKIMGRCLQNPDKYPWPEEMYLYEG